MGSWLLVVVGGVQAFRGAVTVRRSGWWVAAAAEDEGWSRPRHRRVRQWCRVDARVAGAKRQLVPCRRSESSADPQAGPSAAASANREESVGAAWAPLGLAWAAGLRLWSAGCHVRERQVPDGPPQSAELGGPAARRPAQQHAGPDRHREQPVGGAGAGGRRMKGPWPQRMAAGDDCG